MNIFKRSIVLGVVLLGTIALAQADVFRGRVVDAANHPIANAEILVQATGAKTQKGEYRVQHADAQGNFSVDVPAGYASYYGRLTAVAPHMAAASVSLNVADKAKNNIIQLQPAQSVSGRVLDAAGKPVARVKMLMRGYSLGRSLPSTFFIESPWESRYQTFTDKDGRWQMKAVPQHAIAYMMVEDPRFVSQMFNASPGAPSVINVRRGATLHGRVVNDAGKPVANINVTAQGQGNNEGWGSGTTAKDGSYQLTGLSNGLYNIMVFMDDKSQVAKAIEGQAAHEGKSEKLRDLILTSGAFVSGQVTNIKTGKLVRGIMIGGYGPQNPKTSAAAISDTTDTNGHYRLRVVPGKNYVYLMGAPGFIEQLNSGKNISVEAGKTAIQNFDLDPGQSISGIVVDRNGNAVEGVKIAASQNGEVSYGMDNLHYAVSDKIGRWTISALKAGQIKISATGDWVSAAPLPVTLPSKNDVRIVAQKLSDLPPNGRVVDTHHQPLANISVQLQYETFDTNTGGGSMWYETVISDAKGNLHINPQPTVSSVGVYKINQPGYLLTSGGVWNAKTKVLSDIVVDRLNNTIHGQLFNQQNKAVPGVTVVAAGFPNSVGKTGKNGKFILSNLPHRPITLLATAGNLVAKSISNSNAPAILHLKPLPPNHFPTRAQSLDMLEKIYHTTTDKSFWARSVLPYEIAKYDLQRGLSLLKDSKGEIPASQFDSVFYLLQEQDPTRAFQWGKDHLAGITKEDDRLPMLCELAKLAQPKDKALAQKYFFEAAKIAETYPAPQQKTYSSDEPTTTPIGKFLYSRVQLAGAAAVVRPAETHKWVAEIFPYSVDPNHGTRGDYDWVRDTMAQSLGANAPQETEALVENSKGRTKSTELKSAVDAAVDAKNPQLAQRWLGELQQLYQQNKGKNPPWEGLYDFGQATRSVIELIGPKNPAGALKLARSIDDQDQSAQSLMVAAVYQPKQIELATLQQAFDMQSLINGNNLARMAGMIYDIDPAQGKVLFDQLLKQYQSQNQDDNPYSPNRISGVDLAYFLARYKPTVSWMILQNAYAKSQMRKDNYSVDWGTALAMSALNFDHAMQWAQQVTTRDGFNYDAQRKLLQLALATPQTRRTLRFDRLGASDTWMPGEPTGW